MTSSRPSVRALALLFFVILAPAILTLIAGLVRAWRAGGQADPWTWALPAALMAALMGRLLAKAWWPLLLWAALGTAGTVLLFCALAADRLPDPVAAIGLALATLSAGIGSLLLRRRCRLLPGSGLVILAVLIIWRGPTPPLEPASDRPALAVISALPLFWTEGGTQLRGPADALIVTVLRTRFTILPVDDPSDLAASKARLLLLAQPRALSPEALVALDRWVRRGGRALVLADPLLRWPSALPMGDRRRAPSISLTGPLLAHWGITLDPPATLDERRLLLEDGALVTISAASTLHSANKACRSFGKGLGLHCAIGQGRATVVADADLIDDRLWLADPDRPLDPRQWAADTPSLVARWLKADLVPARRWLRDRESLVGGLRLALAFGIFWALMGAALFSRKSGGFRDRPIPTNGRESREKPG